MDNTIRILRLRSHFEILNYDRWGKCRALERDLSVWDYFLRRYTCSGYVYDRENKILKIPSSYGYTHLMDKISEDGVTVRSVIDRLDDYPKPRIIKPLSLQVSPRNEIQKETVDFIINSKVNSDHYTNIRRQINLATGIGKTICLIMAAQYLKIPVLVFSVSLSDQWIEKIVTSTAAIGGEDLHILKNYDSVSRLLKSRKNPKGSFYVMGLDAGIAALKRDPEILQDLIVKEGIGMVVFDEAHEHFLKIIDITVSIDVERIVDLTATPDRSSNNEDRLYKKLFVNNVPSYGIHTAFLQKFNIIMLEYKTRPTERDRAECHPPRGFNANIYFRYFFKNREYVLMMINIIRHFVGTAFTNNKGDLSEKVLIYVQSCYGIRYLLNILRKHPVIPGLNITYGDYTTNIKNKEERLEQLKCNVIFTTMAQRTGLDLPNLTLVLNFVPFSFKSVLRQMRGRLRPRKGKTDFFVDIYDGAFRGMLKQKEIRRRNHAQVANQLLFYKADSDGTVTRVE